MSRRKLQHPIVSFTKNQDTLLSSRTFERKMNGRRIGDLLPVKGRYRTLGGLKQHT